MSDNLKVGIISAIATVVVAVIGGGVAVYTGHLNVRTDGSNPDATVASLEQEIRELTGEKETLAAENEALTARLDSTRDDLAEAQQKLEDLRGERSTGETDEQNSTGATGNLGQQFLSDLDPVDGTVSTDPVTMGGEEYRYPVRIDLATFSVQDVDYDLGKAYSRFTASVGLDDTYTDTDRAWRFKVISVGGPTGDTVLFDETITFGKVVPLDISVEGVLRLRLTVERAFPAPGSGGGYNAYNATWGDATLQ